MNVTLLADTSHLRKERGAFFTPDAVCDFITAWVIRAPGDRVLEPSCGEAAFMLSAARRLSELGAVPAEMHIEGAEIHAASARTARSLMAGVGVKARIRLGDFLASKPTPHYDAVVGNPPYVRFHDFSGPARTAAIDAALRQGVRLTKLASSWAAFVVHSSAYLSDGGRMGFVLPAELLSSNYAGSVRRFLLDRFQSVRLVTFEEPVFPGVMTEGVLLLCEGRGATDRFEVQQLRSVSDLASMPKSTTFSPLHAEYKWTGALVQDVAGPAALDALMKASEFAPLSDWGRVALGAVTGNNGYFMLTPERAQELGLGPDDIVKTSPPGSGHLRSVRFTSSALTHLGRRGYSTLMFRPGTEPSKAARAYIRNGEKAGVPNAYKCRVRSPWWMVPLVRAPDLFITCMNADTPRLAVNEAKARHLNSVHGLYLGEGSEGLAIALAAASLNSATLLGAELVGRSYGGGVLKLEPGEAYHLPLPAPKLVRERRDDLVALIPSLRKQIASGDLLAAVSAVDEVVLQDAAGLHDMRDARAHLAARRASRGTNS